MSAQSSDHLPPSRDKSPPPKKAKQNPLARHLHSLWESLRPTQPLSRYTDGWDVLYNATPYRDDRNQWSLFWHQWWGASSPGNTHLELAAREDRKTTSPHRILKVTQDAVWRMLGTLEDSKGSIILREEFALLYDRLFAPFEGDCSGVLVNGQPGIGKSYFLVYALLRRMGEGQPVLFSTSAKSTLLVDQYGVRNMSTDQVDVQRLPPQDIEVSTSRAWSLIDTSLSGEATDSALVCSKLFVVLASRPRADRYKGWKDQCYAPPFIMEPWFVWELDWLLSVDGLTPLSQDQRARYYQQRRNTEQLVQEVGPCPRDIFLYMSSPNKYKHRICAALKGIRGVQDIRDLFSTADRNMNWEGQVLLLLRRAGSAGGADLDWPPICFKSRDIGWRVMHQVGYLGIEDAEELFRENWRQVWRSRALAHWIFEGLVVRVISGGGSGLNCVSDTLFQMQPSDSDLRALLPRSIKSRRVVPGGEDISSLTLDEDLCYFLMRRDNPVFDAFFLEVTADTVVVWLFKIAIPRKCVDNHSDAFDIVAGLLEKARTRFGKPKNEPKYVLVAPYRRNQTATWDITWREFKGDVHVCHIDVSALGGGVQDLLECLPDYAEPA